MFGVNNSFSRVGPKIFCQAIGIPMGSDPAPFFENSILLVYEFKTFLKTTEQLTTNHLPTDQLTIDWRPTDQRPNAQTTSQPTTNQ